MNRALALLALGLVLAAASCGVGRPEPLVLPYVLHDFDYSGNQVTVTLDSACSMNPLQKPDQYCFRTAVHPGEGQSTVGVQVIAVPLTEGYRPDMEVDWEERIGDEKGSGSLWEGLDEAGTDLAAEVAFGLGAEAEYPVAVFVRVTHTLQGGIATMVQTDPPVAVLQVLPDGGGVARLDR